MADSRLDELRTAYGAALGWRGEDLMLVDFLAAWAVANRWGGRQAKIWAFFVGPSGVGKTESIYPMYGLPFVYPLNTLTDKSLISGLDKDDGRDYSNLPEMDKKLVIMPEFTTIVQMPPQQSNVIMAELRSLYDGLPFRKIYGTGAKDYDVSFGLLACVTPAIDGFLMQHTQLGERFVMYRVLRNYSYSQETLLLKRMRRRSAGKDGWRKTLRHYTHAALKHLDKLKVVPLNAPGTVEMRDRVQAAAQLVSRTRSVGPPGSGEVVMETNAATRLIQQFQNLGAGRMIIEDRDEWDDDDLALVTRVAEDSMSREGYRLLRYLKAMKRGITCAEAARATGIPGTRVGQLLRQWMFNELTRQTDKHSWTLSEPALDMLEASKVLQSPVDPEADCD